MIVVTKNNMKDLKSLSSEEQKHWWSTIAQKAIQNYDLTHIQIEWLAYTHNAVFRVQTRDKQFVLRLQLVQPKRQNWLTSELAWLRYIRRESDLLAPLPIALKSDDKFFGEIENVWLALFEYLEGESSAPLALTPHHMRQIGVYLARLHNLSSQFQPDPDFERPRLDFEGLFGETGIYHSEAATKIFTSEQQHIFEQATAQVRSVMDELGTDRDKFGLIHGDMLSKNILFHKQSVCVIDWEYCGWGYYLYDFTPLLWQLKSQDNYQELEDALWDAYTTVRPLSNTHRQHLETLIVARQVASCRWLASNLHNPAVKGTAKDLVAQRVAELQGFLNTGILKRKSITL